MTTVKIRERKGEFQVYEKITGHIVFRGGSRRACFEFLKDKDDYTYEPTREKGVHYVY